MDDSRSYTPPLAICFVWHENDFSRISKCIEFCEKQLQRDPAKPFSRNLNLPIFFRVLPQALEQDSLSDRALKTIVFAFIGQDMIISNECREFLSELSDRTTLIPIALDRCAYDIKHLIGMPQYLQLKDNQLDNIKLFFIYIAHEIFRHGLQTEGTFTHGTDLSLKIFLSHTKNDDWAFQLVQKIRSVISNSNIKTFFDIQDIAPGLAFDTEIEKHLKNSTLLMIHSDSYFSRYWCQREIHEAKLARRPIVEVCSLKEADDRNYPFAANVPCINIGCCDYWTKGNCYLDGIDENNYQFDDNSLYHNKSARCNYWDKIDIFNILIAVFVETLRFNYQLRLLEAYKQSGFLSQDTLLLARPPELLDLYSILKDQKERRQTKPTQIAYPEPPIYKEESYFFEEAGINITTPLTCDQTSFRGKTVGFSFGALSQDITEMPSNSLILLSQDLARHLISRATNLIYGGDLREGLGGFTRALMEESKILQYRLRTKDNFFSNYFAWPYYCQNPIAFKRLEADNVSVVKFCIIEPPQDIKQIAEQYDCLDLPETLECRYVRSRCLTAMREAIVEKCQYRICAGGSYYSYNGRLPGVLEEISLGVQADKPLYLLGGFGGMVSDVARLLIDSSIAPSLTESAQRTNNPTYGQLLDEYVSRNNITYAPNYKAIVNQLKACGVTGLAKNNGLSEQENFRLLTTPFIDEAVFLVLRGISNT